MDQASESPPALLLVNLGTPDAPTASAVRRYLAEFLHDHRVVQLTRWLWCPLLHFVILPLRSPKVALKYASVWLPGGSPLAVHTAALADAVGQRLPDWRVAHAMRYGNPSVGAALQSLREQGVRSVRVLPLYPQYSTTTTASVADAIASHGAGLRIEMLQDYHRDPAWAAAVATSIRAHWDAQGRGERLLLSFHGIPQRLVDGGDPYAAQCEASTVAIAEALGVPRSDILLTFQSRFGRERWLQPYTQQTLQALAAEGVRTIDVACPGFAVDCLETLEEIAVENAHAFNAAGGEALRYIPCLNAGDAHAQVLAKLAQAEAGVGLMREVALQTPLGVLAALRNDGHGPPVLALHGWLDNAASFLPLVPHLGDIDLVALDLPGHGRSAHLPPGADYSFASAIASVLDAADALGWDRFALLGHSMGAGIASQVAAACPQRIDRLLAIEALGALSEVPERTVARLRDAVVAERALRGKQLRVFPDIETAVRARMHAGRVPGSGLEEPLVRLLVERGVREVDGGHAWSSDPRLTLPTLVRMTEAQVENLVAGIECPTLAIFAEPAQPYLPDDRRRRLVGLLPRGELAVIHGGHHLHMQQPAEVAAAIGDFLLR